KGCAGAAEDGEGEPASPRIRDAHLPRPAEASRNCHGHFVPEEHCHVISRSRLLWPSAPQPKGTERVLCGHALVHRGYGQALSYRSRHHCWSPCDDRQRSTWGLPCRNRPCNCEYRRSCRGRCRSTTPWIPRPRRPTSLGSWQTWLGTDRYRRDALSCYEPD